MANLPMEFLEQYVSTGLQDAYQRIHNKRVAKVLGKINEQ